MKRIFKSKYNVLRRYSSLLNRRHHKNKGGESMDHIVIPDEMKPTIKEILDVLDKNYFDVLAEREGKKPAKRKAKDIVSYKEISDVLEKNIRIVRNELYGANSQI